MKKENVAVICKEQNNRVDLTVASTTTSNVLHHISLTSVVFDDIKAWCSGKKMETWRLTRIDKNFCRSGILIPDVDKKFNGSNFSLDRFARYAFENRYAIDTVLC